MPNKGERAASSGTAAKAANGAAGGPAAGAAESGGVKSARRAIELIEAFAATDAWLSPSDLHTGIGFPRSSLHGLLRTLLEAGWLELDQSSGRYRLGVRALICGTAYLDRDPVVPYATETLEKIRSETGCTTHFARRNGAEVVYLETREAKRSTHLVSRVGRTLPAHATALGKALLAELTQEEIDQLLPAKLPALTPRTLVSRADLHAECARIRESGYASEVEEGTSGVRCVAAVIPYRIPGTDALSCSMPAAEVTDAEAARIGEVLADATADLGRRLRRAGVR
ncbi:IclR family transcriptional regulator [Streptomyces physcomitrii]|uniref:IclR family transcriptional regulator n=1 Tax=Streptomyces physcomitrii TaxID=2724184 RepID=UPI00343CC1B1